MIALVAAAAALQPLSSAAQSALLPHILTGDRYVLGRSVLNLASAGSQLAGLGVGGVLIAALGGHRALLGAVVAQLLAGLIFAIALPCLRPPTTDGRAGPHGTRWGRNCCSPHECIRFQGHRADRPQGSPWDCLPPPSTRRDHLRLAASRTRKAPTRGTAPLCHNCPPWLPPIRKDPRGRRRKGQAARSRVDQDPQLGRALAGSSFGDHRVVSQTRLAYFGTIKSTK